ncbi:Map1-related protein [Ehrlichia ruminantium]|uniref:P44/Msp2 family outer membrane protein n=2 Tax=Ehrlichia ruminantium TaxID=779 RepID=UPI0007C10A6C|nr:P44/Msp2 family outer membrane protein [Ehrlichia ruminantium]QLK52802.1 P44/Msp2 family outer membrane protein [Ehrlichia ruminantium]QLK54636.1 P44/Msp2 family outer membrane protein [Ehrlichia ruminantium]QLK57385.1 P44/Msp2 family outer membrane protein [Ehrlichia ruminantium]QLK58301.1 P44/Msp2 family outer membrane protein [Ehrlichia ruminantium]UOD97866.1 P44/Msp2 family outer membrane protein [Ehrlichia ruminantium]
MDKEMNYKEFVLGVTLSALLFSLLPQRAISDMDVSENRSRFYAGVQYRTGIPNFDNFSASETIPGLTKGVYGLDLDLSKSDITKRANFTRLYNPTYSTSSTGIGGMFGYYFDNIRMEFETSYSNFGIERQWYTEGSQSHKFCAVSRQDNAAPNTDLNNNRDFVVLENNGVKIRTLNVNFCYDVAHGNIPLAPYVCAGIGGDYVKFIGVSLPKFSYQLKFGVNYPLSIRTMLFGGGYYHKVMGSKYDRVKVVYHPVQLSTVPKMTFVSANLDIDYFGCEVGIRFFL